MHTFNYSLLRLKYVYQCFFNNAISHTNIYIILVSYVSVSIAFKQLNGMCSIFVGAKERIVNECFTNCVKLPFHHVALLWYNLHYKASTSILFPYTSPFVALLFFFLLFYHICHSNSRSSIFLGNY